MTKVSEQRMKLRIEYSRETDLIFSDNIPAYADWLEKKLALSQLPVIGSACEHSWFPTTKDYKRAWKCSKCKEVVHDKHLR
jgi:hypothetical protein